MFCLQLEEMRSNHERQVLENDGLLQEKEERVAELLTNLKQLRGEVGSAHLPDGSVLLASIGGLRPPGLARRTATIGVQTSAELLSNDTEEVAVLPVDDSLGNAYQLSSNGERATMMSLGPAEEVGMKRSLSNSSRPRIVATSNCSHPKNVALFETLEIQYLYTTVGRPQHCRSHTFLITYRVAGNFRCRFFSLKDDVLRPQNENRTSKICFKA